MLAERDGAEPRLVETAEASEVAPVARRRSTSGVASVVGVGGDGTMREIAGVLAGTDVPLGVIPAGTGNQVAAALAIPLAPLKAADVSRTPSRA